MKRLDCSAWVSLGLVRRIGSLWKLIKNMVSVNNASYKRHNSDVAQMCQIQQPLFRD
jgi:hypothetical protein